MSTQQPYLHFLKNFQRYLLSRSMASFLRFALYASFRIFWMSFCCQHYRKHSSYFQQVRRRVYFYSETKLTQIIILITYNFAVTKHSLLLMVGTVISKLIYYDSYTLLGRLTNIGTKACPFYGDFSKHLNSGILIETNNGKL